MKQVAGLANRGLGILGQFDFAVYLLDRRIQKTEAGRQSNPV
jgi:hypothetical protein